VGISSALPGRKTIRFAPPQQDISPLTPNVSPCGPVPQDPSEFDGAAILVRLVHFASRGAGRGVEKPAQPVKGESGGALVYRRGALKQPPRREGSSLDPSFRRSSETKDLRHVHVTYALHPETNSQP